MWTDAIPSVEVARARYESCQAKSKAASLNVQCGESNQAESSRLLSSRKAEHAKRLGIIATMKERAIAAAGTPEMEVMASTLLGYEKEAELMASAIQRSITDLNADGLQTAEARVAEAQAEANEADADVILQQALQQEAFEKFSEAVGGGVGCVGVSGIVRRAVEGSLAASKRLAAQKDELKALKEFQNATV